MTKERQKKILILAMFAGEIMMKSGAEIYRVEDTITRICRACGIPYVEVFVTPTGIFMSLDNGDDSEMISFIKRIRGGAIDLGKISETNQFSRDFVSTDLSVEEGMDWLRKIAKAHPYKLWIKMVAAALVSSFFCIMFGGTVSDFFCALVIGTISFLISEGLTVLETNYFIRGFLCTAFAAISALFCSYHGVGDSSGPIIIGTLMLFVPGVAITNAIRDFLAGDMVSGLSRTSDAVITAISLAAGAGVILRLWVMLGGVII